VTDDEREALERLALDALKAIHAGGGMPLSRVETVAFLENPPHLLNGVEPLPAGKRGPRTKRTHYDQRFERMKGRYHLIKRLPDSRKRLGLPLLERVKAFALAELALHPDKPDRTLARRVLCAMGKNRREPTRDIGTIRRALVTLGMKNSPR
jgi:hypothetical protein